MELPRHECGLYLEHNAHKDYYLTARQRLEEWDEAECPPLWESDEQRERAIDTNEIWELQWYPNTPICSNRIAAPTLNELLSFARRVELLHD